MKGQDANYATPRAAETVQSKALRSRWRRAAQSRLTLELAGLSFAIEHGHDPEEYARHIWSNGATKRLGKANPSPLEFLTQEGEAISALWPWVKFRVERSGADLTVVFTEGCLGTGQSATWKLADSFRLSREEVCRYCIEAFRVWGDQLRLHLQMAPEVDGGCALHIAQLDDGPRADQSGIGGPSDAARPPR